MSRERMEEPLFYAKAACDMMMRTYEAEKLPPEGHFHYHQGVFLDGMYKTYKHCGEEKYAAYVKKWVDSCIDEEGNFYKINPKQLDDIQPGILLFPLWDRTGDIRYKKALDHLIAYLLEIPKNPDGGFWHKEFFPNQMWLDGLYMGGPICAEYGKRFERPELFDLVAEQAMLMQEKTCDKESGLWHHAWDYNREADWADPVTGRSPEFWGRSIGWVPMAVLTDLEYIPKEHPRYQELIELVRNLLEAVCRYQSAEGRWYQVINKGKEEGNWPENSCSCLFVAALCKAVSNHILPETYLKYAQKGYEAVIRSLKWDNENLLVGEVCIGTGVGDYAYYCDRPCSVNDLHGVGAFLMMCNEVQTIWKTLI